MPISAIHGYRMRISAEGDDQWQVNLNMALHRHDLSSLISNAQFGDYICKNLLCAFNQETASCAVEGSFIPALSCHPCQVSMMGFS